MWEVSEIEQTGEISLHVAVVDLDLGEFVDLVFRTLERRAWVNFLELTISPLCE